MKRNKGITLIALIITILIMLILVGITVAVVINSNMIGVAKNTGKKYENAMQNEMRAYENVISEYETEKEKTITFFIEGDTTEYTAIEGMEFKDWIASKYNTGGYSVASATEIYQPETGKTRIFYTSDLITDGCTIKEHLINFTIDGRPFTCPEYFSSWEEWAESDYNTTGEDSNTTLENITIDGTRKGDIIDKTTKPEEGYAYGWAGPALE